MTCPVIRNDYYEFVHLCQGSARMLPPLPQQIKKKSISVCETEKRGTEIERGWGNRRPKNEAVNERNR